MKGDSSDTVNTKRSKARWGGKRETGVGSRYSREATEWAATTGPDRDERSYQGALVGVKDASRRPTCLLPFSNARPSRSSASTWSQAAARARRRRPVAGRRARMQRQRSRAVRPIQPGERPSESG